MRFSVQKTVVEISYLDFNQTSTPPLSYDPPSLPHIKNSDIIPFIWLWPIPHNNRHSDNRSASNPMFIKGFIKGFHLYGYLTTVSILYRPLLSIPARLDLLN